MSRSVRSFRSPQPQPHPPEAAAKETDGYTGGKVAPAFMAIAPAGQREQTALRNAAGHIHAVGGSTAPEVGRSARL
ncbi:hypothetical protein [Paenibacillus sp. 1P03SA]|uniref:hypothetical protein n=1 Tax=Paenibacillus sp. 1P03SA TaxID=3132294 RepID=UPI0039A21C6E